MSKFYTCEVVAASLQLVEVCHHFCDKQELGLSSLGVLNAS